jgi:hypothetical protein
MSKNRLGLRRSGGSPGTGRVQGLGAGRAGGLAPDIHLKRPYLPDAPQDNVRDGRNTGRVSKPGTKKK